MVKRECQILQNQVYDTKTLWVYKPTDKGSWSLLKNIYFIKRKATISHEYLIHSIKL